MMLKIAHSVEGRWMDMSNEQCWIDRDSVKSKK